MKDKLIELLIKARVGLMMWLGNSTFHFIKIWQPNKVGALPVITFADSEREANIAFRTYVEELDNLDV